MSCYVALTWKSQCENGLIRKTAQFGFANLIVHAIRFLKREEVKLFQFWVRFSFSERFSTFRFSFFGQNKKNSSFSLNFLQQTRNKSKERGNQFKALLTTRMMLSRCEKVFRRSLAHSLLSHLPGRAVRVCAESRHQQPCVVVWSDNIYDFSIIKFWSIAINF